MDWFIVTVLIVLFSFVVIAAYRWGYVDGYQEGTAHANRTWINLVSQEDDDD